MHKSFLFSSVLSFAVFWAAVGACCMPVAEASAHQCMPEDEADMPIGACCFAQTAELQVHSSLLPAPATVLAPNWAVVLEMPLPDSRPIQTVVEWIGPPGDAPLFLHTCVLLI